MTKKVIIARTHTAAQLGRLEQYLRESLTNDDFSKFIFDHINNVISIEVEDCP